jgi:hypothetical protein
VSELKSKKSSIAVQNLLFGVIGMMIVSCSPQAATLISREDQVKEKSGQVHEIKLSDEFMMRVGDATNGLNRLLDAARPTIGTPYKWGGTQLEEGIDCSNYTWQLYRKVGFPYKRFLGTMVLSRLKRANGLRSVSFEDARAGDLLVYGYRDDENHWFGHVVILIDKSGEITGHKGLVLGAHGKPVSSFQFITFTGFEEGFFKEPRMRLCNVLRVDDLKNRAEQD